VCLHGAIVINRTDLKDYYKILGVAHDCPQADIKKAYRQLALQHHPDKNQGNKKSEEHFKLIAEAYVILNDPAARNEYDYSRGVKSTYRGRGNTSGKPSPIQYLLQIKAIKNRVLTNGGHVKQGELYTIIFNLLSDDNITHLLAERDITTNNLIVDEVLTCCIFLNADTKEKVYEKLQKLAVHYSGFNAKLAALEKQPEQPLSPERKTVAHTDSPLPLTTKLVFLVFVLLFILILVVYK